MGFAGIRKTAIGAFTALLAGCLLVPVASARQDSDSGTQAAKSPTAKSTTALKTPPKPHSTKSSSAGASKSSGKATTASSKKRSSRKKSAKARGQQKIDSERAQSIQEALIREHYLTGDATGTWNEASEEAMRRYQADHGWQSKTVPDSRALISLGLGPSKDHLLNPESAMTTVPDPPKSQPIPPTSHSTPATAEPVTPASSAIPSTSGSTGASGPQ
jgi:Putative peptidoglycan binding domain